MRGSKKIQGLDAYRVALGMIANRFLWDLKFESWRSRRRLRQCREPANTSKAVIVCNGPSLNFVDFGILDGLFCIGMNKINLLFDKTSFRPNCIACVDATTLEQHADYFNSTQIPLFISHDGYPRIKAREGVIFLHSCPYPFFSEDISSSIYTGYTVTFVALQIAFHMGYRDVAIVGCDHNYAQKGRPNARVTATESNISHFSSAYYTPGQAWHLPDYVQMEYSFELARDAYLANGGRVINCTDGGHLEVFPRMPLKIWKEDVADRRS